jgi:hypothetical protein
MNKQTIRFPVQETMNEIKSDINFLHVAFTAFVQFHNKYVFVYVVKEEEEEEYKQC